MRRHQHSFPTRRSSDLIMNEKQTEQKKAQTAATTPPGGGGILPWLSSKTVRHAKAMRKHVQKILDHRSEEHTSELQSPMYLVCRLLLEKKKRRQTTTPN